MRRSLCLSFILMLIPHASPAIQLTWSSGASTLSFTEATRCTLVVSASPEEQALPSEWRLLWVADSCSILPLALNPQEACQGDIALVSEVDLPITPADSAANMTIAHFCSGGSGAASMAFFLLDLPAGATGRLEVAAIDPTDPDSSRVIQSSEVTFNGGADAAFSPVVLHASISHPSLQLTVTAVGAGLEASMSASIVAADTSWRVPLDIVQRTASMLTAVADVATPPPAATLQVFTSGSAIAEAPLAADAVAVQTTTLASSSLYRDPNPAVYPKDFAFVYNTVPNPWRGMFRKVWPLISGYSGPFTEGTPV